MVTRYCFEVEGINYDSMDEEFVEPILVDVIEDIEDYYMEGLADILITIITFDEHAPKIYAVRKKNKTKEEIIIKLIEDIFENEECEIDQIRMVY